MNELFSNDAIAQLTENLHVGDDRIYVDDVDVFPSPQVGLEYFTAVLVAENCRDYEIVEIADKGPSYLIASQRGAQGTTPRDFVPHSRVVNQLTAASLQAITDSYASFSSAYLGSHATSPTVHPVTGAALVPGQMYWNTAVNALRVYTGAGVWRDMATTTPGMQNRWVYEINVGDDPTNIPTQTVPGTNDVDLYGNLLALDDTHVTMVSVFINGVRQVASDPGDATLPVPRPPVVGDYTVDKANDRIILTTPLTLLPPPAVPPVVHVLEYVGMDSTNIPVHDHDPHNDLRYAPLHTTSWRQVTVDPSVPANPAADQYQTITAALDAEGAKYYPGRNTGLVIQLADGTHTAPADSWGWPFNTRLTIQGNAGNLASVTLDLGPVAGAYVSGLTIGHSELTWITNMTIRSSTGWDMTHRKQGINVSAPGDVYISDCVFENMESGVLISAQASVGIERCIFRSGMGIGIMQWLQGFYTEIKACQIQACTNTGVTIHGPGTTRFSGGRTTIDHCPLGIAAYDNAYVEVDTAGDLTVIDCSNVGVQATNASIVMLAHAPVTNSPYPGRNVYNLSPVDNREGNSGSRIWEVDSLFRSAPTESHFARLQRLYHP